jgi:ATP-binding cassette subfamily B (MDR/TAP) protein 1
MDSIKPNTPSWKSLFYFTTQKHLAFLLPAICSAVLAGLAIPANAYVLGKVFGQFTKYGTGTIDAAEFKHSVNKYNLYLLAIASGCWFFNSGAFCLWHTFGDLQARSARERLFNALLKHQIGWFDLRKDGIGALSSRLLTYVPNS